VQGSGKTDAYDREVGLRVRTLRLSRRMSQNDLGQSLGISLQQIQKYEHGANRIGAGRLQRIAEIFEVPVAALFGASRRENRAGVDPFEGLRTPGAVQPLEAYGRIGDRAIRRAFLRLAEQVAVTAQRSSRR
jgi:transcriptional regulator with XRE-family HTH domain